MDSIGAYEAKTHLSELLERVASGETITITRHGMPVAVLGPVRQGSTRSPAELIDAFITKVGVLEPPYDRSIAAAVAALGHSLAHDAADPTLDEAGDE